MAWLPGFAARMRGSLAASAGVGVAVAILAYGTLPANGETGPPSSSGACGSALAGIAGRPARITAGVGATESTRVGARFPIRLAVSVTGAERNPVPGAQVTFSAPTHGPSGRFAAASRQSHSNIVKVRTDACGVAVAPAFTANDKQGGYIVKAGLEHVRPAAFALVNVGPGQQL